MFLQILIGCLIILATTFVAGIGFLVMEYVITKSERWLLRPPHPPKLLLLMCAAVAWILVIVTIAVWIWGVVFLALGVFVTAEASVYFSIVAFTTLGFGDILLTQEWRLLAGMAAINGLLMIGLFTAILVEVLRRVRSVQAEARDWSS